MGHECESLLIGKQTGERGVVDRRKSTGSQACTHSHVLNDFQNFKLYIASCLDTDRLQLFGFFLISEKCSKCNGSESEGPHSVGSLTLAGSWVCYGLCWALFRRFFGKVGCVCTWRCFFSSLMGF